MIGKIPDIHRRAIADYRIALSLELRSRRTNANYSLEKFATHCGVTPAQLPTIEAGISRSERL
jgi:transcriptional regulator with XRE-family HTH domain